MPPSPAKQVYKTQKRKGALVRTTNVKEGMISSFDKTPIYYRYSLGKGIPMVCCSGIGVTEYFWSYFERHFRFKHPLVLWDYRGHGRSGLKDNPKNYSIDALVKDCEAVCKHLKIKKAIFVGYSLGVQVILEIYRRSPQKVVALIPTFGAFGEPMTTFYNTSLSKYLFEIIYWIGTNFPDPGKMVSRLILNNPLSFYVAGLLKFMHTGMMSKEDNDRYMDHLFSVDSKFFLTLLKSAQEHSAEDVLKKIKVPTMIIAGEEDQFTPLWIFKKMHHLIPKSELLVVPHGTHAGIVEQPDLMNLRIEKFIQERLPKRP